MAENLLIVHGGGPTAVLNASLYGAVMEAKESGKLQHIYGADNGTGGFLEEKLIELEKIPQEKLDLLLQTPGTAIGTSRDPIWQEDYEKLADCSDTKRMSDEEAKDLLYDWYGFAKEKIRIHHSVPVYEVNRHGRLRKVGKLDRSPLYNATDWNYIRFDCGCMSYELKNDSLRPFVH